MIFICKVIDENNEISINKIESKNKEEVLNTIRSKGLRPISIKEESKNINIDIKGKVFKTEDLSHLLYEMHILLGASITVPKAIEICAKNYDGNKRKLLSKIHSEISSAKTLSDALKETNEFPRIVINMVKVGEESANLSDVLYKLSKYYSDKVKFEKKVRNALAYPILLLVVSIIVVNFLVFNILPTFAEIFRNSNADLPIPTRVLIGISTYFKDNLIYISLVIVAMLLLIFSYSKSKKGKYYFDKIAFKNKMNRRILTREFLSMFNILVDSGITVSKSLEIIEESMYNLVFKEKILKIIEDVYKGMSVSESVKSQNLFDPMVVSMLSVAEESNEMPMVLDRLYKYYETDIESKHEKYISIFEPIMILILSIFVGFIVISVAIPMFDLVNKI